VDDDGIPEIYADCLDSVYDIAFLTYKNGQVYINEPDELWYNSYRIDGNGYLVCGSDIQVEIHTDLVYSFANGPMELVATGDICIELTGDPNQDLSNKNYWSYYWNGKIVTKAEYESNLAAYTTGEIKYHLEAELSKEQLFAALSEQQVGGKWYYFNGSGAMLTGWQKIGSTWYYFRSGGEMVTGWLKDGSTWYYFYGSGAMATGSVKIGTKTYNFNSSGACLNP